MTLHIGIDFDNTIICYDGIFHAVALEQELIPSGTPRTKEAVRGYLRAQDQEDLWTELQGEVYGRHLRGAEPFPGAEGFIAAALREGNVVSIISHKTRRPYRGPAWDLHAAALDWLEYRGFFDPARIGLGRDRVFFSETRMGKLARIGEEGCSHFLDDLPEILLAPEFPEGTERLLFGAAAASEGVPLWRLASWDEVAAYFSLAPKGGP